MLNEVFALTTSSMNSFLCTFVPSPKHYDATMILLVDVSETVFYMKNLFKMANTNYCCFYGFVNVSVSLYFLLSRNSY